MYSEQSHLTGRPKERIKNKRSPFHESKYNGKLVNNGLFFNDNQKPSFEVNISPETKEERLFNKIHRNGL